MHSSLTRTPVATAVLLALGIPTAVAQETSALGEVIVTAQKREQSLQDVPISLDSLGEEKLEQLNVQNFKQYVQFLPTVTMAPSLGAGAGYSAVYMRGIATGGDGQATTSLPSVGMYLDEQPITTVQGNLDIHLYDIARVEALAGPQGTLYGASSQAGTIRIITNRPDPSGFKAGYALEGNMVDGDEMGYVAEGFVNLPVGEKAALRLVGWSAHDAGWIDNKLGTRTYPIDQETTDDDFVTSNDEYVEKNYNTIDTIGARAALRVNLNDNWTVTPSLQYQKQEQEGSWGDDINDVMASGDHAVAHFREEYSNDEWYQAGVTIEGSMGGIDIVYSGNYLDRDQDGAFDYSDYSFFYDSYYTSGFFGELFVDDDGNQLNPDAQFMNDDQYKKQSHELRISTPQDKRVRGLLGFFYQKQEHDFYQEFGRIEGLTQELLLNRDEPNSPQYPGVVYLNSMDRKDTDKAVFGQLAFDITDQLELSVGARYFEPEVTLKGFFGFSLGFWEAGWTSQTGERQCDLIGVGQADRGDAPCFNVNKGIKEDDWVGRVNLSWKPTDAAMLYATWSEGYRPGGVQRNPFAGDYVSDFLTNWELGWKARFADDRLQLNGAIFLEQWDDIQISFQGDNGITQVDNGPKAEVKGIETQLDWLPTDQLRISAALAYYDSELKDDYCDFVNGVCANLNAPAGTALPLTPDFKANLVTRYTFPLGNFEAHVQGALAYQTSRASILEIAANDLYGDIPSTTFLDLAFGVQNEKYAVELFVANATDEDGALHITSECTPAKCGVQPYRVQSRPRTIGIRFSQEF